MVADHPAGEADQDRREPEATIPRALLAEIFRRIDRLNEGDADLVFRPPADPAVVVFAGRKFQRKELGKVR